MTLPITSTSTTIATIAEQATAYAEAATADNTRRAYRAAWADFTGWCAERHLCPLPAEESTVGLYLADRTSVLKRSTRGRRLAAISVAHKAKS